MLQNRKKSVISFFLLFTIIIAAGIGFSLYTHKLLDTKLTNIEADLKQRGYVLTYSSRILSKNPFDIHVTLQNPSFRDQRGLIEWKGQEARFSLRPWNPFTLSFSFSGDQSVNFLEQTPFPLGLLKFEETHGRLTLTSNGILDAVNLTIGRLVSFLGNKQQSLSLQDLVLKVDDLSHPLVAHLLFKTKIMGLEDHIKKGPRDPALSLEGDVSLSGYQKGIAPKTLAEWRDGGGVLEVNVLKMTWPPIVVEANGTLTLDNEMYPLGSFSSRIEGSHEALGYMVDLGWVKSKNASAVGFVLDLLSKSDDTGKKHLTIPITLQNKKFSIGPASLFKLQPIKDFQ